MNKNNETDLLSRKPADKRRIINGFTKRYNDLQTHNLRVVHNHNVYMYFQHENLLVTQNQYIFLAV